ncbi:hypothetical protein KSP40_PGU011532 [Platanthera guangdongensis]|uniref:Lil3 protein n=1 Tax=Platanthera guangdongensis TaxID=2320717 RepID=A0ABR2LMZ4_9ASPA
MASSLSPSHPAIFTSLSTKSRRRSHKIHLTFLPSKFPSHFILRSSENEAGGTISSAVEEKKEEVSSSLPGLVAEVKAETKEKPVVSLGLNGAAADSQMADQVFKDPRWVSGTWDLMQFQKGGKTDWDAVIDAEARRRKWLEDNPEASSEDTPVNFETSIIPWWVWVKRYHLPEAELLNGRAAMIGFFMAYFVDSLTGLGLVDQMGNFYCKTLLFISVAGVLLIRKNEDIENLKKLFEETTFYDRQWQATWRDDVSSEIKNK